MTSRLEHMCVSDCKAGIGFVMLFAMVSKVNSLLYKRFHLGKNGSFSSPNYPTSYPEEILYEWIFPVTPDSMSLDFIHMDLYLCYHVHEGKPSCDKYDHVTIEGYGTYCNWYKPTNIVLQPWTSTTITFRSFKFRKQCRGDGFKANYRTILKTTRTPTRAPTDNPTDSQRKANGTITIIIIIASITVSACIVSLVVWCVCCKCKTANQIPQAQQNQTAVICENENIEQSHVRYSELLSNNDRRFLRTSVLENADVGPPPSYNVACNDDQNNINDSFLEENLESPPSYENAMSGQTQLRQSQESLIQEVELRSGPPSTTGLIDIARENENEISLIDSLESNTERNEIFV